jgi:hypothetical protein
MSAVGHGPCAPAIPAPIATNKRKAMAGSRASTLKRWPSTIPNNKLISSKAMMFNPVLGEQVPPQTVNSLLTSNYLETNVIHGNRNSELVEKIVAALQ